MLPREFVRIARAERMRREEERFWHLYLINHIRAAHGSDALTMDDVLRGDDDEEMSREEFERKYEEIKRLRAERDSR